MRKKIHQQVIDKLRQFTPLSIRQRIGPVLAELYYLDRIYIRPNQKKPIVLSIVETIKKVKEEKLSVIRFGDGEITLIEGSDLLFQKWNSVLAKQLETIIKDDDPKLLICIPGMWDDLKKFEAYAYKFIKHHMYRYKHLWDNLVSYDYTYGETNFTRNYLAYKNKPEAGKIFSAIKSLWENEDTLLIEGEKSRLGVGNDLFQNVSSLHRILCPAENAYNRYQDIVQEVEKQSRNTLILLSLGPAAKVIAYELFKKGYRVLDIGHIDMEYEMYLRKSDKQVAVPYKYFNEIHARNPQNCLDDIYLSQIITKIT